MIVVIQCAAGKQHHAGHLRTRDGQNVMFVARPECAPPHPDRIYARPDDLSDRGKSWRTVLQEYNDAPGANPLGLLPAWKLYRNATYGMLAERFGPDRLYILSAGWGLIRADYLTPNYDITFSKAGNVEPFKRRHLGDAYEDLGLPSGIAEPIAFFGGRDYVSLFCRADRECGRASGPSSMRGARSPRRAASCRDLETHSRIGTTGAPESS